jgi:predicted PurR-regulated permease PerM
VRSVFAGALLLLALWVARPYLVALVWAVVIALAVWPLYARLAARASTRSRRVLTPLLFTLATALLLAVPFSLVTVEIGREGQTIVAWITEAQQNGIGVPDWLARMPLLGEYMDRWWRDHLGDPKAFGELLGGVNGEALSNWFRTFGGEFFRRLFLVVLTFMALFLLLRDGEAIAARMLDLADRWLGNPGERLAGKMVSAVRGTVNGTVLVAVGEGALIGVAYFLAGVPHPILFSIITVAVAMVPFGAWAAFTAAALLLVGEGGSGLAAAGVFVWGAVVMLAGDNFVQPALIGGAARLPFLAALIGIFGGLEAFGLVGLFVGPVIMAALLTVWREWLARERPADSGAAAP